MDDQLWSRMNVHLSVLWYEILEFFKDLAVWYVDVPLSK